VSFPAESLVFQQHLALNLIDPDAITSLPVHPVQLYEPVLIVLLLVTLQRVEGRQMPTGMLALLALGGYSILRFFIEFVRADNALVLDNLTFHQLICVVLLLVCIVSIPIIKRVT